MISDEEISTADSAQIESLIERVKQGKLEQNDAQLIERLLRAFLELITLLQRKKYNNQTAEAVVPRTSGEEGERPIRCHQENRHRDGRFDKAATGKSLSFGFRHSASSTKTTGRLTVSNTHRPKSRRPEGLKPRIE